MTTSHEDQAVMYDDTTDTSTPHDTTLLDTTQSTNSLLGLDGETAAE